MAKFPVYFVTRVSKHFSFQNLECSACFYGSNRTGNRVREKSVVCVYTSLWIFPYKILCPCLKVSS